MVMVKRTGQESLLNRTMAPSGVVCVAAHDGLWMMGSGHSKRWAQMKQKPKAKHKSGLQKKHADWWSYLSTSLLKDAGEHTEPHPSAREKSTAKTQRRR